MIDDPGPFHLFLEGFPAEPGLDVALSAVLQDRVATGAMGPSIRLHPTSRMVAFGRRDTHEPGFPEAVAVARGHGFLPINRLAGGRAAVFHEATLAMSVVTPERDSTVGIRERFAFAAETTAAALRGVGVDARVGEVPGEYCPGEFSVNARGRLKVAGYGQRLVRGAAHVGGVIVLDGTEAINAVLLPVYAALGLTFDPATTGSVAGEVGPDPAVDVLRAVVTALGSVAEVVEADLPRALVDEARARVGAFVSPCT